MSTEATGAVALDDSTIAVAPPVPQPAAGGRIEASKPTGLHSPPESNNDMKLDGSDSELSDLDDAVLGSDPETRPGGDRPDEDDIGEVLPDHWSGTVPVFRPTMHQFKDFKRFMEKVDSYGMKSGIIKIIPPEDWKNSLPALDDLVKTVRVKEPIKQEIMGSNGTYRQVNILHQRSYNLPQWRQLCDQSEHQPPARRGERRANADKPKPAARTRAAAPAKDAASAAGSSPAKKGARRRGRLVKGRSKKDSVQVDAVDAEERPMTPVSPRPEHANEDGGDKVVETVEQDPGIKVEEDEVDGTPTVRRMGFARQSKPKIQSTSARRKYSKREGSAAIDEAAFKDFDYRMDISDYTPERCEELERIYWKTLTYAPPLYGADLLGTLFHESTDTWNLNKLPNLLDVLGTKVPGVNTAYLYLGMWKATFAWHLEDVDLYSINYLHFGAPKQWYSISQADARRFEAAMKSIWPTDAKACDQFLRHKAFLISPAHLQQHYNIKVNKCVSYPGEFVVTYPYGYHSGYNLGYNCAEAVNFALDSWLPMGKIAKKCECAQAQDSVWIDVYEIERKLRGESTEYEETEDEEEEEEEEDETGLPTPTSAHTVRMKAPAKKRKRATGGKDDKAKAKIRLRVKKHAEPPCCLCPNDIPGAEVLPTDDGRKAHRLCALYLPETYIETVDDKEVVTNAENITKARMDLKCLYCRSKRGACFQCSQKKCARSYHATCAAAAGVWVEEGDVPVHGEDGTIYKEQAFDFSCRFHRTKRDKRLDGDALEQDQHTRQAAAAVKKGDVCQLQYYRGDIFAGVVVENRQDEETFLLDIIPNGDRVEVEWKWLLLPDPADYRLPKAPPNALPMPTSRKAKDKINATKRYVEGRPRADDAFVKGFTWAEFHTCKPEQCSNEGQAKVDLFKADHVWHYLGKTSTESKAQYTEDPRNSQHNTKSSFLDSVPKLPPPPRPQARPSYGTTASSELLPGAAQKPEKPYVYKPRKPVAPLPYAGLYTQQQFAPGLAPIAPGQQLPFGSDPRFNKHAMPFVADRFMPVMPPSAPSQAPQAQSVAWPAAPARIAPSPYGPGLPQHQAIMPTQAPVQTISPQQISMQGAPADPHTPAPQITRGPQAPQHAYQKYAFFQVNHNRDSSRYRTPYSPWGGFTNGFEGNLRAYLMSKPDAIFKDRRLSFGLGGGLQGLTRPPSHKYSSSTGSSRSSPFTPSHARSRSGAASPASSQVSPAPSIKGHRRAPSTPKAPLHPAIRPQYGMSWQNSSGMLASSQTAQADQPGVSGSGTQQQPGPGPSPVEGVRPRTADIDRSSMPPPGPQHTPGCGNSPLHADGGSLHDSPAQQLQQQLRRISDPKESPFRLPRSRPHSRASSRGHTPRTSLHQVPRLSPQVIQEHGRLNQSPAQQATATLQQVTATSLAANGVSVRAFPEVPAESMALVEKMMLNLRKASEGGSLGA